MSCVRHVSILLEVIKTRKMFIRPTIKPRYTPVQITSHVGASVVRHVPAADLSECSICQVPIRLNKETLECNHCFHTSCIYRWLDRSKTCPTCRAPVINLPVPSGNQNRIEDVIKAMKRGTDFVRHASATPWRPPMYHEWYAEKLGLGADYIKRCEDWKAAHPTIEPVKDKALAIDSDPILKMMKKYSKKGALTDSGTPQPARPPLDRMVVAWECAGYTPEQIELAVARQQYAESMLDVRQQAINSIFGNYPSASKPTTKKSKKVIKAVKKKMG